MRLIPIGIYGARIIVAGLLYLRSMESQVARVIHDRSNIILAERSQAATTQHANRRNPQQQMWRRVPTPRLHVLAG